MNYSYVPISILAQNIISSMSSPLSKTNFIDKSLLLKIKYGLGISFWALI